MNSDIKSTARLTSPVKKQRISLKRRKKVFKRKRFAELTSTAFQQGSLDEIREATKVNSSAKTVGETPIVSIEEKKLFLSDDAAMSPKSDRNSMEYSRSKGEVVDMMLMSRFDGNIKPFAASANKTEEQSIEGKTQEARVEA